MRSDMTCQKRYLQWPLKVESKKCAWCIWSQTPKLTMSSSIGKLCNCCAAGCSTCKSDY